MVFQFGEFFNDTPALNAWLMAILEPLVVVVTFFLGLYFTRIRDERTNKKAAKELREYIYSIVESLKKPFDTQIASIKDIIVQLNTDDHQDYAIPQVPTFSMRNIKQLQDIELFKAFVNKLGGNEKDRVESFRTFKDGVEYFDKVIEQSIPDYFENFFKKLLTFNEKFELNAEKALDLLRNEAVRSVDENDSVSQGFREIATQYIIASREHTGLKHSSFVLEHAILPLIKLSDKNIEDPRCQEIAPYLIVCKTSKEVYNRNREFYVKQYTDLITTMEGQKAKIDNSIAYLKSLEK